MTRTVIYSCLLGDYDELEPLQFDGVEAYCFTDRPRQVDGWKCVNIEAKYESIDQRIRQCRMFKMLSHRVLPPHDCSIWIDCSLRWIQNPLNLVDHVANAEMATFKYPSTFGPRNCLYKEAEACVSRCKDNSDVINAQIDRYRKEGFPENSGLVETSIVVRRCTDAIKRFNELWWRELFCGSRRDQLSFNYVASKIRQSYRHIPGSRVSNEYTEWRQHNEDVYT